MYRSIVVGTDGSESAQTAVGHAVGIARLSGARLTVVSAYRQPAFQGALVAAGSAATFDLDEVEQQARVAAQEVLDHSLMRLDTSGVQVSLRAECGEPAEALLAAAASVGADLLVVGNRGMSGVARFLLGSVPNRVAHHATCAVLIVHTC